MERVIYPISNEAVLQAFLAFPTTMQPKLMALRDLIFATAETAVVSGGAEGHGKVGAISL